MPTPDGRRSVADAEAEGMPLVDASGIKHLLYHRGGCTGTESGYNTCRCRLDSELRRLAHFMAALLQEYPQPPSRVISKGTSDV